MLIFFVNGHKADRQAFGPVQPQVGNWSLLLGGPFDEPAYFLALLLAYSFFSDWIVVIELPKLDFLPISITPSPSFEVSQISL